ncbi:MAG: hypothetical protein GEU71_04705 [Actinobacteria bacterium]|nr:hypothetical protein [Actinomycetota bacterium]
MADGSERTLRALGRVSANFAALEVSTSLMIWALIGDEDEVGQIVTAKLSYRQLLDILAGLTHYRCGDSREIHAELMAFIKTADAAQQKRNIVLHSAYTAPNEGEEEMGRLKMRLDRKRGLAKDVFFDEATSEVEAAADQVRDAANEAFRLMDRLEEVSNVLKIRLTDPPARGTDE